MLSSIKMLKRASVLNAKNMIGWRTQRKLVTFSVDDYGNVRVDSKKARNLMDKAGLRQYNRFDAFDTLETREDIEALFNTLSAVKDSKGNHAIFTPFAVPCNINFEHMQETNYKEYSYELLPETFEKMAALQPKAYEGAWQLIREGITKGFFMPQFHGREHLNLKILMDKLAARDHEVITALQNRSYTSISTRQHKTISPSAAFDFWDVDENEGFKEILIDGLNAFEQVYGYRAVHFNPPGGREHPSIHKTLYENGIQFLDTPLIKKEHQGRGDYHTVFNYTGKRNKWGQFFLVRNVVFEPTEDRGLDWVSYALQQIEAAFKWNRPAIISSHRVNFCGHIDENNRKRGIDALQRLLKKIVKRWPDVEFIAANKLGQYIAESTQK